MPKEQLKFEIFKENAQKMQQTVDECANRFEIPELRDGAQASFIDIYKAVKFKTRGQPGNSELDRLQLKTLEKKIINPVHHRSHKSLTNGVVQSNFMTHIKSQDKLLMKEYPHINIRSNQLKKRHAREINLPRSKEDFMKYIKQMKQERQRERESAPVDLQEVYEKAADDFHKDKQQKIQQIKEAIRDYNLQKEYLENPYECPDLDQVLENNLEEIIHNDDMYEHLTVQPQYEKEKEQITKLAITLTDNLKGRVEQRREKEIANIKKIKQSHLLHKFAGNNTNALVLKFIEQLKLRVQQKREALLKKNNEQFVEKIMKQNNFRTTYQKQIDQNWKKERMKAAPRSPPSPSPRRTSIAKTQKRISNQVNLLELNLEQLIIQQQSQSAEDEEMSEASDSESAPTLSSRSSESIDQIE